MFSYRKLAVILLCCVGVGLLIWYSQRNTPELASSTNSAARSQVGSNSPNGSSSNGALGSVLPGERSDAAITRAGIFQGGLGDNSLGIYNESVRSLIRSNSLAKIDYGFARLNSVCRSFLSGQDGVTAVRKSLPLAQLEKGEELLIGNATVEERVAGFQRSLDRCTKLYEGAKLSEDELALFRAQPSAVQYRALRNALAEANNFDSPQAVAALSTAVAGPMFDALTPLLFSEVNYAELTSAYGKERGDALRGLTFPLVLCRMGDDCGPSGTVTEQLCWQFGICGQRVEEAIFANLRDRGLDTTAFSQFIFKVHQALLVGDTSIFRKQKPTK